MDLAIVEVSCLKDWFHRQSVTEILDKADKEGYQVFYETMWTKNKI